MNEGLVVLVRGFIAFFSLLIFTRILGKQQLSQLTFFEYILGITIGSIASELTVDLSSRAWPHFIGLFIWFLLTLVLQLITLKSKKVAEYLDGEPTVVIMNGKILVQAMKRLRFRLSDLLEMLRQKDVFDISEVEFAILEINGSLSVMKKAKHHNVTLKDMKIKGTNQGINIDLIYDGKILKQNLEKKNLKTDWLFKELKKHNVQNVDEVFYATLKTDGNIQIYKYDYNVNTEDIPSSFDNKEGEKN